MLSGREHGIQRRLASKDAMRGPALPGNARQRERNAQRHGARAARTAEATPSCAASLSSVARQPVQVIDDGESGQRHEHEHEKHRRDVENDLTHRRLANALDNST